MSFAHLHVHTDYSQLDGASRHELLFAEAARLGMPAVASTDHGNMFGAHSFHAAGKAAGVKPIIGIEAYIAPGSRHVKEPVRWGEPEQKGDDVSLGAYTHMTLLAENATGLRNLFKLSSLASTDGYYYKPRMDRYLLAEHAEGIIATTGCPSGEVQTRMRLGHMHEAAQAASDYRDIFGDENFFVEVMDHGIDIEARVRDGLLDLGHELNLPFLATNDAHYVTRGQARTHDIVLCVGTGSTIDDPKRFSFAGDGYYLKPADQMRALFADVPDACNNTLAIAERIESYDEVFAHRDRMPRFAIPVESDPANWLAYQVHCGLGELFPVGVPREYLRRADEELKVIIEAGFADYFLVVGDIVNWAREQGIGVGPGRGSAVGSLVSYALGITRADPIEHGLLFERFLNPERVSMPDIDIDFEDARRGEVMDYVADKYGHDRVAQVITFGTIKAKAALKDAARALHGQGGYALADKISKALPAPVLGAEISLADVVNADSPRHDEAAQVRSIVAGDAQLAEIFETAQGLEGLIRQPGVHACAVIMSQDPLADAIPVWKRPKDGALITGFDYPACESMGLLKMDFLGLRNLTVLSSALRQIETNRGSTVELDSIPFDDEDTFGLLRRGDTLGVFQLDGGAMRELLRRMKPTSFDDVAAVLALYRPGPMGVNAHNDYADRKNGRQAVVPIHAELAEPLAEILEPTYGLIVYQEQIMLIAQAVAGYTPGQADTLRKAMGKKKADVLAAEFERFSSGMQARGFSREAIKTLWDTILPFAGYAFNKSHAVGYGMVSYWTAYLKANYPAEYMAAVLTSVGDDKPRLAQYLADCRRCGITVLPPDVNTSAGSFAAVGDDIRFGLDAIRNVGENVVKALVENRPYRGAGDLLVGIPNGLLTKRALEALVKAGALDSFGESRSGLMQVHEQLHDGPNRPGLLLGSHVSERLDGAEWHRRDLLAFEREVLGLYVSSHPLLGHDRALSAGTTHRTIELTEVDDATKVVVAGVISELEIKKSKRGNTWASLALEDLTGQVEAKVFGQTMQRVRPALALDAVVRIAAKLDNPDGTPSLIVNSIMPVTLGEPEVEDVFEFDLGDLPSGRVGRLRGVLAAHRGTTSVLLGLGPAGWFELGSAWRVTPSAELARELAALQS